MKFECFKNNITKPKNLFIKIDNNREKSNILLHCAFIGLHIFICIWNIFTELDDLNQTEEIVDRSKYHYLI